MAGIQTSIKLNDQMTATLRRIEGSLDKLISKMSNLEKSVGGGMNRMSQVANKTATTTKQAIDKADSSQKRFNRTMSQGVSIASTLGNAIKVGLGAYLGTQAVSKTIGLADTMQMTRNRLDLLNDGLQTTDELENKIYQSAMRSRAGFLESADAVAKLGLRTGKVFDNMDEVIAFNETLNKMFVIAGTGEHERYSATLQLTQALGSGVLRGQEFIAVFEAAPNVMQAVADYMDVPIGKLKDMAAEGEVTADIVKNAMFKAAEQTNAKFKKMSYTFGHIWTGIKNHAIKAFRPVLKQISAITSSQRWIKFIDSIGTGIERLAKWTSKAFTEISKGVAKIYDWVAENKSSLNKAMETMRNLLNDIYNAAKWVAEMFIDNWSLIEPIVWGIVASIAALKTEMMITSIVGGIKKIWAFLKVFGIFFGAIFTKGMVGAVGVLKTSLAGLLGVSVGTFGAWAIAIIAVLVAIWLVIEIINKVWDLNISFFGFLCAFFASLIAMIWNVGAISWNVFALILTIAVTIITYIGTLFWNLVLVIINAVSSAGQFIVNCAMWVYDNFGIMCDNAGIAWDNFCNNIKIAFYSAMSACLKALSSLLSSLSGIPFIGDKFAGWSSNLNSIAGDYSKKATKASSSKKSYKSLKSFGSIDTETFKYASPSKNAGKVFDTMNNSLQVPLLGEEFVGKAYKWGANFSFGDFFSNLFGGSKKSNLKDFDYEKTMKKMKEEALQQSLIPTAEDYTKIPTSGKNGSGYTPTPWSNDSGKYASGGFGDNPALDEIVNNTKDIANNTSVETDEEDLSYMRDMATKEAIDRHTTRNIKIEMSNNNNFNNGMDFNTFLNQLYKTVAESVNSSASGVHY